jgi:hypothetical protein
LVFLSYGSFNGDQRYGNGIRFQGESVTKKHLDKTERNPDAEKAATSADNLAF